MKFLFIIGNKRSGSTHLTRLLNYHPNIFVSNESDILWILYSLNKFGEIKEYEFDSPYGMEESLKCAGEKLKKEASVIDNFMDYQDKLMRSGFLGVLPSEKSDIVYCGDKKPYQNIDPEIMPFIVKNFTDIKFIHILRHPFEVVSSSLKFMGGKGGYLWRNKKPEEILDKWVMHEQWVLEAQKKYNIDVLEVRYSDLIENTKVEMKNIFTFLGLEFSRELVKKCRKNTLANFRRIHNYKLTKNQESLLEYYSFQKKIPYIGRVIIPKLKNIYFRIMIRIGFI